ncbi:hypothetical protein HY623_00285 [Candidatus Uhrbacteria bacterium]|nr:hypothetical protein [Candidatus Uhrbacteria bacterium]
MSNATLERESQEGEKTVDELIEDLRQMKIEHDDTGATPYPKIIREIAECATGVMNEKRMKLYSTWSDDDFQKVLDALEEDLLSGE